MLKRMLVPLDGSAVAEQAIPTAGRLARATGGSVMLLRVVLPPVDNDYGSYMLRSASAELDPGVQIARQTAAHYLEGAAASNDLAGVKTEVVVTLGPPAAMIESVARARGIDLIVMSSHDNTNVNRSVLGSVARTVTRHAAMPVLVLHQQTTPGGPVPLVERPLRVLVPLDGSRLSEAAIKPAAQLAAALAAPGQGAIHLLQVVKHGTIPEEVLNTATKERLLRHAKDYLASIAGQVRGGIAAELKVAVTWSVTLNTDAAHAIIRAAEGGEAPAGAGAFGGCDLIVLAIHGRVGLRLLATGSVAGRILAGTRLPVCIVRPGRAAGEQTMSREKIRRAEAHVC